MPDHGNLQAVLSFALVADTKKDPPINDRKRRSSFYAVPVEHRVSTRMAYMPFRTRRTALGLGGSAKMTRPCSVLPVDFHFRSVLKCPFYAAHPASFSYRPSSSLAHKRMTFTFSLRLFRSQVPLNHISRRQRPRWQESREHVSTRTTL